MCQIERKSVYLSEKDRGKRKEERRKKKEETITFQCALNANSFNPVVNKKVCIYNQKILKSVNFKKPKKFIISKMKNVVKWYKMKSKCRDSKREM